MSAVVALDLDIAVGPNLSGPIIHGVGQLAIAKRQTCDEAQAILGEGLLLAIEYFDQVKAKDGSNRLAHLPSGQAKGGPFKLWHQVAWVGPVELPTLGGRARVLGEVFGQLLEGFPRPRRRRSS